MSPEIRTHRLGIAAVVSATLFWSTSGLFVRWIEADLFAMLFWRGLFSGLGVFVFFVLMEGRCALAELKRFGWPSAIVMMASAFSMICGIGAIRYTTAADAMSIYATLPFVAAGAAWAVLGERPARSTMIASTVAFLGVLVMVKDASFGSGAFGKLLAVGMTLGMVTITTTIRRHPDVTMLPALGASAFLCSGVCGALMLAMPAFADGVVPGFAVSARDLALCAAFGIVQSTMGLSLYAIGSRLIRSSEAALFAALEVPLTPLWLWLLLNEVPANATLIGGSLVMAAMLGHVLYQFWRERFDGRAAPGRPLSFGQEGGQGPPLQS